MMKPTTKFVIFREETEEFLGGIREGELTNLLGWHANPMAAINYNSLDEAKQEAQRISDNQGYELIVCELHESHTEIGLEEAAHVAPTPDPNSNLE